MNIHDHKIGPRNCIFIGIPSSFYLIVPTNTKKEKEKEKEKEKRKKKKEKRKKKKEK